MLGRASARSDDSFRNTASRVVHLRLSDKLLIVGENTIAVHLVWTLNILFKSHLLSALFNSVPGGLVPPSITILYDVTILISWWSEWVSVHLLFQMLLPFVVEAVELYWSLLRCLG